MAVGAIFATRGVGRTAGTTPTHGGGRRQCNCCRQSIEDQISNTDLFEVTNTNVVECPEVAPPHPMGVISSEKTTMFIWMLPSTSRSLAMKIYSNNGESGNSALGNFRKKLGLINILSIVLILYIIVQ